MTDTEAIEVLRFLVEHDMARNMFYGTDDEGKLWIAENCNDLFYWACADMEEITPETLPILKQAIADCDAAYLDHEGKHKEGHGSIYAGTLYACRIRGMRPQTPCYGSQPPWIRPLLDACGPDRPETGTRSLYEQRYEDRQHMKPCTACKGTGRISAKEAP